MKNLCWIFLALSLSACQAESLIPLDPNAPVSLDYVDVDAKFCTSPRSQAKQKVKYLFILDHSQSNKPGFPLSANDATSTDPSGARRYGPLVQFVNNLEADPNNLTYFSLIDFQNTAITPLGTLGFIQDRQDFIQTYVLPDWIGTGSASVPNPNDQGFTNYQAALQAAFNLIKTDAQNESFLPANPVVTVSYQIIFVSDGVPVVADLTGTGPPTYTQDYTTVILPKIAALTALKTDLLLSPFISSIALNTAYYFQASADPDAESLLTKMSVAGGGQYLRFGAGQSIAYQAFAPAIRNIKYNLSDVWLENKNVIGWETGELLLDSDGDGLPDKVEIAMGSQPRSADSDGNGVSDLVEYRTKGKPCNGDHCEAALRDPYSICDGFSPLADAAGRVSYPSAYQDGLNDCEKFVLGADRNTFDSNGDFIPDLLSLKNSIPFIAGTSGAYLNPFADQLNNYAKLKLGYPIPISQRSLLGFEPRVNALTHETSSSPDFECYHLTSKHVAVLQYGNEIQISLIENNALIDNKTILLTASKKWSGREKEIFFTDGDFK